jgi:hypothetical protein
MNIDSFIEPNSQTLIWTLTSHGYQFLTWNLVKCLEKLKVPWKLCVICADNASYDFMRREGISAIKASTQLPDFGNEISPFGSGNFQRLNLLKLKLLHSFASETRILNCVYLDGDIAIYKNFLPDILWRLNRDSLLFQCDEQKRDIVCGTNSCPWVCTGFIAWKIGYDGGIFNMNDKDKWLEKPEDEAWVNHKLKERSVPFRALPRNLYPNGTFVSLVGAEEVSERTAYLLHYNYRVGNQKISDMKRFGDWHLTI